MTFKPRTRNNAVPLDSHQLLEMTIKGHHYYVAPVSGYTGYFVSTCGQVISCVSGYNGQRQRVIRDQPKILKQLDKCSLFVLI